MTGRNPLPLEGKLETEKFVVRLPPGMRELIAAVARRSHRSMNSEIITRLEVSLANTDESGLPTAAETPARGLHAVATPKTDGEEALLLKAFRRLSASQQQALLQLIG